MEPIEFALAALVISFFTKTAEKSGEEFGKNLPKQIGQLFQRLQLKSPQTLTSIEAVKEQPLDFPQVAQQLQIASQDDPQIAQLISEIHATTLHDPQLIQDLKELIHQFKSRSTTPQTINNTIEKMVNMVQGDRGSINIQNQNINY